MKYYVYKYLENGSDLLKMGKAPKKLFPDFCSSLETLPRFFYGTSKCSGNSTCL